MQVSYAALPELSEVSSSAKWEYEPVLDGRDAVLVTGGSDVRFQVLLSSSMEDNEANDVDVVCGGNIRSLIRLCKQRGVGMESYPPD
jgi:hypothetical protein